MKTIDFLRDWIPRTFRTAGPATAATTIAVAACGRVEDGNATAPVNAISHILWGDEAARQETLSTRYTVPGIALNSAAIVSWAAIYELGFGRHARQGDVSTALFGGISVAAWPISPTTMLYLTA